MHLAHAHMLRGYLGPRNTMEKIHDCFHWPGMFMEVKSLCQECPLCHTRQCVYHLSPCPSFGSPLRECAWTLTWVYQHSQSPGSYSGSKSSELTQFPLYQPPVPRWFFWSSHGNCSVAWSRIPLDPLVHLNQHLHLVLFRPPFFSIVVLLIKNE